MVFADRAAAGRRLAERLVHLRCRENLLVLAPPRQGVRVAYEVALALDAPLDVLNVCRLDVPGGQGTALGAIADGPVLVLNDAVFPDLQLPEAEIRRVLDEQRDELGRREELYRAGRPHLLKGRHVVLVDDCIRTGATLHAAVNAVQRHAPAALTVAVPVASAAGAEILRPLVDELVFVECVAELGRTAEWYEHNPTTSEDEVRQLLEQAEQRGAPA